MASNPATVQEVENRWRPLTPDERMVAETLLDDAWALLKHHVPTLEARLDADPAELDAALVRPVLVAAVQRVLRNPDGVRQQSAQDYSVTHDNVTASGVLVFSDDEIDLLAPTDEGNGNAFTIRPAYQVPVGMAAVDAADWQWRP